MKTFRIYLLAAAIAACHAAARAQTPQTVNYQGRVAVNGVNFNGTGNFKFALVHRSFFGEFINEWSNDGTAVGEPANAVPITVTNGNYSVLLGDSSLPNMTPIPSATFYPSVALRIWFDDGVNGSQQLSPDIQLGSVPYAMIADRVSIGGITSQMIAPGAVGSDQIAPGAITGNNISSNVTLQNVTVNTINGTFVGDGSGLTNLPNSDLWTDQPVLANIFGPMAYYMGRIGIGVNFPMAALHVAGSMVLDDAAGPVLYTGVAPVEENRYLDLINSPSSPSASGLKAGGILVSDDYSFGNPGKNDLIVKGTASVASLTIRGGADLAEPFHVTADGASEEIPVGSVLVIDEQHAGNLKLSTQPYDTRVAGILSGAGGIEPGIHLEQSGVIEGGRNVALTGRVYVRAEANSAPIQPSDLLTTSNIAGLAMRASDHSRAQGATLGKAMTALESGEGLVLVLVSLQ